MARDHEIVAILAGKIGVTALSTNYDEAGKLRYLNLSQLDLLRLPREIGQLVSLQRLDLSNNRLSELPAGIWHLTRLQTLDLYGNQLRQLPPEIGRLTQLQQLGLENNFALHSPPPEIVAQGTKHILAFLSQLQEDNFQRYEAKLLVVG